MVNIEVVVGLLLFVLAFMYALLDMAYYFKKDTQENQQLNFLEYGVIYLAGYYQILLKALLSLLFIFVFLMVYNIILVGVFKPLISDTTQQSGDITYREIISKAKDGYFGIISSLAKLIFTTVFRIVDVRFALLVVLLYIPITIFIVVITYHLTIARKIKMENSINPYDTRTTNYHFMTLLALSFIIISVSVVSFIGFKDAVREKI